MLIVREMRKAMLRAFFRTFITFYHVCSFAAIASFIERSFSFSFIFRHACKMKSFFQSHFRQRNRIFCRCTNDGFFSILKSRHGCSPIIAAGQREMCFVPCAARQERRGVPCASCTAPCHPPEDHILMQGRLTEVFYYVDCRQLERLSGT